MSRFAFPFKRHLLSSNNPCIAASTFMFKRLYLPNISSCILQDESISWANRVLKSEVSTYFFFFLSHSVGSWHCSINFGRSTGMGKWILSGKGLVNILPQKLTVSRCWISTLYSRNICKRLVAIFFLFVWACVFVCFEKILHLLKDRLLISEL